MRMALALYGAVLCLCFTPALSAQDEQAIRKLDADWSAATQSKDVEKAVSVYADDAVFLPDQGPKAEGKVKIKEMWTGLLGTPGLTLTFAPAKIEVSKSKDLAYDVGTYQIVENGDQGTPKTTIGKYVVVWKKQADKQWKVVADIYNPDK